MNELNTFINALHIPYFIFFVGSFILLFLKNKRLFLFVTCFFFFLLSWRSLYHIQSSRYNAFLVVLCFLFLSFVFQKKSFPFKDYYYPALVIILCVILPYSVYKLFSPFRNSYIFDIVEQLDRFNASSGSRLFIPSKELMRIGSKFNNSTRYEKSIPSFISEYDLWNGSLCIISIEQGQAAILQAPYNLIAQFARNSKHSSFLRAYEYSPSSLRNFGHAQYSNKSYILNGDIEIKEDAKKKKSLLSALFNRGVSFYDNTDIELPKAQILFSNLDGKIFKDYPEVSIESTDPISGSNSLRVSFGEKSRNYIYLFNRVPSVSGELSFSARKISGNGYITIKRFDYSKTKGSSYHPGNSVKHINFPSNSTYHIELPISKDDYMGETSIFVLYGKSIQILLDDITFTSTEAD